MRPVADVMALNRNSRPQPGKRQPLSRCWSARRSAGGIVRVRAPTSVIRPSASCRNHDAARIARQTPRRFLRERARRRRAPTGPGIGVGEHLRVDMNDHLVALAGSAGIHSSVKGGLGDECQRVRLLLLHGRRLGRAVNDGRSRGDVFRPPATRQCLPRRGQRLHHDGAGLRVPGARGSRPCRLHPDTHGERGCDAGASSPAPRPCGPFVATRGRSARHALRCRPGQRRGVALRSLASRRASARGPSSTTARRARGPPSAAVAIRAHAPRGRARARRPARARTRQESQWAHDRKPWPQPPRASNPRMRSRSRAVAASRCAASSAISSPRRSSSTMCGSVGTTLGPSMFIGDSPCADSSPRFSRHPASHQDARLHADPDFSSDGSPHTPTSPRAPLNAAFSAIAQSRRARAASPVKSGNSDTPGAPRRRGSRWPAASATRRRTALS